LDVGFEDKQRLAQTVADENDLIIGPADAACADDQSDEAKPSRKAKNHKNQIRNLEVGLELLRGVKG